ncbi:carbohydrate ABC transporter permease [Allofournierella sp.]|uniref:carbohydrate ABC transporter permease n=1 Tax=Allofournierella sp. TaxID=1940256 RepID=UPI003FA46D0A
MCLIAFKDPSESLTGFHSLVVQSPTFSNFIRLTELIPIAQNTFNSTFTTLMGTVTSLFFCSLAGFAFAKYKFPGRNFLFYFLLATMLVPAEVGAVPLFIIMKKVNLINSLWSLIIPKIATAIGIFYMNQYISDVPDELIEAARIDGCTDFQIYWKVILPIIKPALASWGAVTLISRWNDFFWPLLFLRKQAKYTLIVTISLLPISEGLSTPWPVIMAGTTLVIIPIIVLYLILERFQKAGSFAGAVKG